MDADPEAEGGDKDHDTSSGVILGEDVSVLFVDGSHSLPGDRQNLGCLFNNFFGKLQIFQIIANNTKLNFVELAVSFRHYSRICILSRYMLFIDVLNSGSGPETWTGCSRITLLAICSLSVRRIRSTCRSTIGWSGGYSVPARREVGSAAAAALPRFFIYE